MPEWKDVLAALAALVASFAGAWAAFRFEARRRTSEEQGRNVGAGNRAIYGIYGFWNVLEQYRKEALEPFRARDDRWLNLAAHPAAPQATDRFQTGDLQFLLEKGHPSVFAALLLEQQRFDLALALIQTRSELVLNSVFPKLARAGFPVGKPQDLEKVRATLGIDLCHQLQQLTDAIYANIDEDLSSLKDNYKELREALEAIYPGVKYIQIEFQGPQQRANADTPA